MAIGRALRSSPKAERGTVTRAVIGDAGLTQGAFAQQVATRYRKVWGRDVVSDCNDRVPDVPGQGPLTDRRRCTHPFLYNEPGLMAGAEMEDPKLSGAGAG